MAGKNDIATILEREGVDLWGFECLATHDDGVIGSEALEACQVGGQTGPGEIGTAADGTGDTTVCHDEGEGRGHSDGAGAERSAKGRAVRYFTILGETEIALEMAILCD